MRASEPLGIAFRRGDATLRGIDVGRGRPVLFQHGLGGSATQVAEAVPERAGFRRLTLDCRGQGGSDAGTARPFSLAAFADDVLAFCDARGVARFAAGGFSMGAAIALRLAVRHPDRVRALVLARPAWLFDAAPPNLQPYRDAARALRSAAGPAAWERFLRFPSATALRRESPETLRALHGFFEHPDAGTTASLLADIAADGPGVGRAEAAALVVPTLVVGHEADPLHPLATAEALAAAIPGATLVRVPPKARDKAAHLAAFRQALARFLDEIPDRDG